LLFFNSRKNILTLIFLLLSCFGLTIGSHATTVPYVWKGKCVSGCVGWQTFTMFLETPNNPWNFDAESINASNPFFVSSISYYDENSWADEGRNPMQFANQYYLEHDKNHISILDFAGAQVDTVFLQDDPFGYVDYSSHWSSYFNLTRAGLLTGHVENSIFRSIIGNPTNCPPRLCVDYGDYLPTTTPLIIRGNFVGGVSAVPLPTSLVMFFSALLALVLYAVSKISIQRNLVQNSVLLP
jgi:hypothetical protein